MDTSMPSADQVLASADEVAALPRRQVRDLPGVHERALWSDGTQVAGVMELSSGTMMPEHVHDDHGHHVWVVEGEVDILGRTLTRGAYAHVPPRVPHEVAAGPHGCTLFYVFTT